MEFAYNNTLSATTSIFLIFANITVYPKCNIASF